MSTLFNHPTLGALAHRETSVAAFTPNAREEGYVGNLHGYARLYVSFGEDCGVGPGSVPIEPGKGLDFSDSPVRLAGPVYVRGTTDSQTFTFSEVADAESVVTIS